MFPMFRWEQMLFIIKILIEKNYTRDFDTFFLFWSL